MNTEVQILERKTLPDVAPEDIISGNILTYVEQKLGYKHPKRDRLRAKGRLAQALKVGGPEPLTDASVARYKKSRLPQTRPVEKFRNRLELLWQDVPEGAMWSLVILTIVSGITLVSTAVSVISGYAPRGILNLLIVASIFFASAVLFIALGTWSEVEVTGEWVSHDIRSYNNPIPEFALATMMEVHQRVPEVNFFIEELTINRKLRDPFLIAELGEEKYYLEVWAEPGYKQERKA